MSDIGLGQTVDWLGQRAEVVGIMAEPSAIIEFPNGERQTVVLSNLAAAPLPPLPTEPGSVITWENRAYLPHIAQLDAGRRHLGWRNTGDDGTERWLTPAELAERIDGATWTLLEPRAVTARAVLDRVTECERITGDPLAGDDHYDIAREFGVSS